MYKTRRYKPKVYRNYFSSYSIKDEFSPSLKKASTPNYYQRKGRIIQQSPLRIRNSDTTMMTSKKLDKMYQTLLQYKYKFPSSPNINLPVFSFIRQTGFTALFYQNTTFDQTRLKAMGDEFMYSAYRYIYDNYNLTYALSVIQFNAPPGIDANSQYHLDWSSNLLANSPQQLFIKSVDTALNNSNINSTEVHIRSPVQSQNRLSYTRFAVTSGGGINSSNQLVNCNDPDQSDNGSYPFMDTAFNSDGLYYGSLEYVQNSGNLSQGYITLIILATATPK